MTDYVPDDIRDGVLQRLLQLPENKVSQIYQLNKLKHVVAFVIYPYDLPKYNSGGILSDTDHESSLEFPTSSFLETYIRFCNLGVL